LAPALSCESLDKLAAALLAFDSRFAVKQGNEKEE